MPENGKVVVGGTSGGLHFRLNLKRKWGDFYDPTAKREGTVLLPQSEENASSCGEVQE